MHDSTTAQGVPGTAAAAVATTHDGPLAHPVAPRRGALRKFWHMAPAGLVGGAAFLAIVVVTVLAPAVSPYDPLAATFTDRYQAPSMEHWLGTDHIGRDLLSRVIWGGRISIGVSVGSVLLGGLVGVALGMWSGFAGGWVDQVLSRLVDILLAFPLILMAILIVAFFGTSPALLILAIGIAMLPRFMRHARGVTLMVREQGYVESAFAVGKPLPLIYLRDVLPNIASPLIVTATFELAVAIIIESSLSYLGLGAQPPTPTWGNILNEARQVLRDAPWAAAAGISAIGLCVLSLNLLGDGLRDYLDPRSHT